MMRVLFVVLDVCMLRECGGDGNDGVGDGGGVVRMSMWVVHVVQVLCLTQLTCQG